MLGVAPLGVGAAVRAHEVAHLLGEGLLVGLRRVGPVAVAAADVGDEVRVRLGEPGEVDLAHAWAQVQQHGRDGRGAGVDAGLHDGVELVGAVGQARAGPGR